MTIGELKEILNQYNDNHQVTVKTWSSEIKEEIEIIEGEGYIILKGE
jgi:hypothetical protein